MVWRWAGQEEKQHKQEVELAAVDVKAFKKMSLEEKKSVRRKKDKLKHAKLAKTKLHSKILTCSQCGDRFAGPVSTAARQRRFSPGWVAPSHRRCVCRRSGRTRTTCTARSTATTSLQGGEARCAQRQKASLWRRGRGQSRSMAFEIDQVPVATLRKPAGQKAGNKRRQPPTTTTRFSCGGLGMRRRTGLQKQRR